MSQYKVKNYEGYQEILDSVRSIVKRIAPEWAVLPIVQEIDDLETTIDETMNDEEKIQEIVNLFNKLAKDDQIFIYSILHIILDRKDKRIK